MASDKKFELCLEETLLYKYWSCIHSYEVSIEQIYYLMEKFMKLVYEF